MRNWLKQNKKLVGAIGIILVALLSFCGYQAVEKETTVQSLQELNQKGLEEADKPVSEKGQTPLVRKQVRNPLSEGNRPSAETIQKAQTDFPKVAADVLGSIEIPSIQLKMPILKGDSFENMLYGACTVREYQNMGKGNYALAAHNAGVAGLMFTSLPKVAIGDKVTVKDRSLHVYTYQVTEKKHVNMTDTSILNLTRKPTLTLITCDQATKTDGRIVVIAELI